MCTFFFSCKSFTQFKVFHPAIFACHFCSHSIYDVRMKCCLHTEEDHEKCRKRSLTVVIVLCNTIYHGSYFLFSEEKVCTQFLFMWISIKCRWGTKQQPPVLVIFEFKKNALLQLWMTGGCHITASCFHECPPTSAPLALPLFVRTFGIW